MKSKLLKKFNKVLICFTGLLGFTVSCNNGEAYGTPQAEYILKGVVKSSKTEQVIKGIKVSMSGESDITDIQGNYNIRLIVFPELRHQVTLTDIDTLENGFFLEKDTIVFFPENGYKGGDDWNKGTNEMNCDIYLQPKE